MLDCEVEKQARVEVEKKMHEVENHQVPPPPGTSHSQKVPYLPCDEVQNGNQARTQEALFDILCDKVSQVLSNSSEIPCENMLLAS